MSRNPTNVIETIKGWHAEAHLLDVSLIDKPDSDVGYGLWVITRTRRSLAKHGGQAQYMLAMGPVGVGAETGRCQFTVGVLCTHCGPYRVDNWPGEIPNIHGFPLRAVAARCPSEVIPHRAARQLMTRVVDGRLPLGRHPERHPLWDAMWLTAITNAVQTAITDEAGASILAALN
jgi:hypothetical protein